MMNATNKVPEETVKFIEVGADEEIAAAYEAIQQFVECEFLCPSVYPKSDKPSAEWLGIDYDGYADGQPVIELWECSNCGYEHKGDYTTLTNYCPNCGAKMESEDNNDTD